MEQDKTAVKRIVLKGTTMVIGLHLIYKLYQFTGLATSITDLFQQPVGETDVRGVSNQL